MEDKLPPIGIEPEWLWREKRAKALIAAIRRYNEAEIRVPSEWLRELSDHIDFSRKREMVEDILRED